MLNNSGKYSIRMGAASEAILIDLFSKENMTDSPRNLMGHLPQPVRGGLHSRYERLIKLGFIKRVKTNEIQNGISKRADIVYRLTSKGITCVVQRKRAEIMCN